MAAGVAEALEVVEDLAGAAFLLVADLEVAIEAGVLEDAVDMGHTKDVAIILITPYRQTAGESIRLGR